MRYMWKGSEILYQCTLSKHSLGSVVLNATTDTKIPQHTDKMNIIKLTVYINNTYCIKIFVN